jgi:hypothetical protein
MGHNNAQRNDLSISTWPLIIDVESGFTFEIAQIQEFYWFCTNRIHGGLINQL